MGRSKRIIGTPSTKKDGTVEKLDKPTYEIATRSTSESSFENVKRISGGGSKGSSSYPDIVTERERLLQTNADLTTSQEKELNKILQQSQTTERTKHLEKNETILTSSQQKELASIRNRQRIEENRQMSQGLTTSNVLTSAKVYNKYLDDTKGENSPYKRLKGKQKGIFTSQTQDLKINNPYLTTTANQRVAKTLINTRKKERTDFFSLKSYEEAVKKQKKREYESSKLDIKIGSQIKGVIEKGGKYDLIESSLSKIETKAPFLAPATDFARKFRISMLKKPYQLTVGAGNFIGSTAERGLLINRGIFTEDIGIKPAIRETFIEAPKRVPRAVFIANDPRTPEGLANLFTTAVFIKSTQMRFKTTGTPFSLKRQAYKFEKYLAETKPSDINIKPYNNPKAQPPKKTTTILKKTTEGKGTNTKTRIPFEKRAEIIDEPTVTTGIGSNIKIVQVKGGQTTTIIGEGKFKDFTKIIRTEGTKTTTIILKGNKVLSKTISTNNQPTILFTEGTKTETNINQKLPDITAELKTQETFHKGISTNNKGIFSPKGTGTTKTTQETTIRTQTPAIDIAVSKGTTTLNLKPTKYIPVKKAPPPKQQH